MTKYALVDQEDLRAVLAEMYATLKRHEGAILELIVEVESMRSLLAGNDAARFQSAKQKILSQRAEDYGAQLRLFDVIIEELSDT
jgi:hypothetical protein